MHTLQDLAAYCYVRSSELFALKVSVRWTHLALRVGEKLRTVDTQHGSNSLTVLVQICEVNTICQQVSDYLLALMCDWKREFPKLVRGPPVDTTGGIFISYLRGSALLW